MTARGLDVLLRREPVAHGGDVVLREVTVGNDTFKVYPSQSKELIRIVERDAPEMGNGTKWLAISRKAASAALFRNE